MNLRFAFVCIFLFPCICLGKQIVVETVRGMNFDYIISEQGNVVLNPIDCDSCAIISVKGEPSSKYNFNCFLSDIQKDEKRIGINSCIVSHNNRLLTNSFVTDSIGEAFLVVGAEINVSEKLPRGNYRGKININITKQKKEIE